MPNNNHCKEGGVAMMTTNNRYKFISSPPSYLK